VSDVVDGMASLEAVGGAVAGVDGPGALPDGGGSVRPADGDSGGWRVAALTMERQRDTARAEVERLRSVVEAVQALADQAVADSLDPSDEPCAYRGDHDCHSVARFYLAQQILRVMAPVPSAPAGETR